MQAVHSTKGAKRYRYYVSKTDGLSDTKQNRPILRIPAREIEQLVRNELRSILSDPIALAAKARLELTPA